MSETNIPDEARAAFLAAFSDEDGRWHPAWWERALAAAAPHIRAAERQRLHDHVEADALAVLDKYDITLTHGSWREILTELTALVSPVSDDTGRTLCPKCKGKRTVPPVSPGLPVLCSRCTGMGTVPVSDDTGGTKP